MKPPAIGPGTGPMNTNPVNDPSVSPRSTGSRKWASASPTTAIVDAEDAWEKLEEHDSSTLRATATEIRKTHRRSLRRRAGVCANTLRMCNQVGKHVARKGLGEK